MPSKALKFCRWQGCDQLVSGGYCDEHDAKIAAEYAESRGSARKQGYDNRWDEVRHIYLSHHPTCERCSLAGRTRVASMVHHIVAIKKGGPVYDEDNLMALCNDCHEEIHAKDRFKRRQ